MYARWEGSTQKQWLKAKKERKTEQFKRESTRFPQVRLSDLETNYHTLFMSLIHDFLGLFNAIFRFHEIGSRTQSANNCSAQTQTESTRPAHMIQPVIQL